ncbi:hypothetical protein BU17DRAFT_64807 [Hysterangium stoloniferum]|nr:hypothetical protein BU17DRAFT_64807 [Hysterangium stoloniferum]
MVLPYMLGNLPVDQVDYSSRSPVQEHSWNNVQGAAHPQQTEWNTHGEPNSHPVSDSWPPRHEWTESRNTTMAKVIEPLMIESHDNNGKRFFCGWAGCDHVSGFVRKAQLMTHIRSVHLSEKPFLCTTCNASFTRRQDAVRHVETMNSVMKALQGKTTETDTLSDVNLVDTCSCRSGTAEIFGIMSRP